MVDNESALNMENGSGDEYIVKKRNKNAPAEMPNNRRVRRLIIFSFHYYLMIF
jgi:hypothetical protein